MSVRKAIYDLLDGDAELATLSPGGIWFLQATRPDDTDDPVLKPLTIFQKTSGTATMYTLDKDDPPTDEDMWMVKGVGSSSQAEDIDERCQEILQDAPLMIEGRTLLLLIRVSAIPPYVDDSDGEKSRHIGSVYRLESVQTS